jgi:hypothetical protein
MVSRTESHETVLLGCIRWLHLVVATQRFDQLAGTVLPKMTSGEWNVSKGLSCGGASSISQAVAFKDTS